MNYYFYYQMIRYIRNQHVKKTETEEDNKNDNNIEVKEIEENDYESSERTNKKSENKNSDSNLNINRNNKENKSNNNNQTVRTVVEYRYHKVVPSIFNEACFKINPKDIDKYEVVRCYNKKLYYEKDYEKLKSLGKID